MKKFLLLFLALLTTAVPLVAQEGFILTMKDGRVVAFAFSEKPVLIMEQENLVIKTQNGNTVSFPYGNVRSSRYSQDISTGVNSIGANGVRNVVFNVTADGLEVSGLENGERVSAYSLSGKLVAASASSSDKGATRLNLPGKGVFIINTSTGIAYKIIKK